MAWSNNFSYETSRRGINDSIYPRSWCQKNRLQACNPRPILISYIDSFLLEPVRLQTYDVKSDGILSCLKKKKPVNNKD